MAKIDTTKIEGFDALTPEQKVEKLLGFEIDVPAPDYSGYVKKDVFDKTASDLAKLKKEQLDRLDEEARKKALAEEELETLKSRNAELEKAMKIAEYTAKYLSLGYSEALAKANAEAFANGDMDAVFANQQKFLDEHDKKVKAGMLGGTQAPPAGSGSTISKDEIMAIKDDNLRIQKIAENIDLF